MKKPAIIALLILSTAAYAGDGVPKLDPPKSVEEYVSISAWLFSACKKLYTLNMELGEDAPGCDRDLAGYIKNHHKSAIALAKKNRSAIDGLQKYREAVLTGLAGFPPVVSERRMSYQNRLNEADVEVNKLARYIQMQL